uniref:Uncharacterized protein n=1 Tax=Cacopsylla melanoneura TaxID=428564 RepID=A0A8D8QSZ5_9HEMI
MVLSSRKLKREGLIIIIIIDSSLESLPKTGLMLLALSSTLRPILLSSILILRLNTLPWVSFDPAPSGLPDRHTDQYVIETDLVHTNEMLMIFFSPLFNENRSDLDSIKSNIFSKHLRLFFSL